MFCRCSIIYRVYYVTVVKRNSPFLELKAVLDISYLMPLTGVGGFGSGPWFSHGSLGCDTRFPQSA